ncbi:acetyltransferase [Staphylococcus aureus]|nr:acetyltransferase [Staphylococcus aureus]
MTNNDTIMLRHYVPQDYSMLEAFQLSESDLKFVKTPEENITAAMSDNERYPIVVMDDRQCVAFFTLHRGKESHHLAITKMQYFLGHLVLINVIVIEE